MLTKTHINFKGLFSKLHCQLILQSVNRAGFIHKSRMKTSFTVCVEGNIASGKTRLLEYFKKFAGIVQILEEPTQKWRNLDGQNVLAKMYEDPVRWGGMFQSYSQLTMLNLHTQPHICPVKIMERSLFSGRYCFIENLHSNKTMSDLEYSILSEWFNWLVSYHDVKVDLIDRFVSDLVGNPEDRFSHNEAHLVLFTVYLQTKPEVVHERIKKRLRPEEQAIPLKYLQDLHNLHEDWLIKKSPFQPPAPVLVLDADKDLPAMYEVFEQEKSKILFNIATNSVT